jgi:hypothetical protein
LEALVCTPGVGRDRGVLHAPHALVMMRSDVVINPPTPKASAFAKASADKSA